MRMRTLFLAGLAAVAFAGPAPAPAGHDLEEPTEMISAEQLQKLLKIGEDIKFIDLRTPAEFAKGRLPDAVSIPIEEFEQRWPQTLDTFFLMETVSTAKALRRVSKGRDN